MTGFVICEEFPFLGAMPNACVHDPSQTKQYGLVEIKVLTSTEMYYQNVLHLIVTFAVLLLKRMVKGY